METTDDAPGMNDVAIEISIDRLKAAVKLELSESAKTFWLPLELAREMRDTLAVAVALLEHRFENN